MIFAINGSVERIQRDSVIISTASGLDYEIFITQFDLANMSTGASCKLFINEIIREDSYTLYGFISESAQKVFQELIKVNGIGPKVAMTILSQLTINELISCVRSQTLTALTSVKGLGKKGAEKLLLALRDKWVQWLQLMPDAIPILSQVPSNKTPEYASDAIEALVTLGYDRKKTQGRVLKISENHQDVKQIITIALKELSEAK